MKVALIGYGKMGRLLETRLLEKGHTVTAIVDPSAGVSRQLIHTLKGPTQRVAPSYTQEPRAGGQIAAVYATLQDALDAPGEKSLRAADAAIEFTHPDCAVANLLFLAREKIPTVTGTTGWYDHLPQVCAAVNAAQSSLLWASNFSLGVHLFFRIAEYAAGLFDPFADYDVGGMETHHNKKADSPSGTARTLVERTLAHMTRKKKAVYETLQRPPAAAELHYASVRAGAVPGTHSLFFDSAADTIELTHTARSREGFAAGAVHAAEWLAGNASQSQKRTGVFTMDDVLDIV
jgi:4-hydroxy-tetrahydrodipicolinate reductase